MKKVLSILIISFFIPFLGVTQEMGERSNHQTPHKTLQQTADFYPQEKLYLQIDKPEYLSGETLWFRAHLLNALLHMQTNISRYVYVELINPIGTIVNRVKIRPDSLGHFHGHLPLSEELAEGVYMLRAYTLYMKNLGDDYFFKKNVSIINPLSVNFDISCRFLHNTDKVTANLTFTEKTTMQKFTPNECMVAVEGKEYKPKFDSDEQATITFRTPKDKKRIMTLTFQYSGERYTKHLSIPYPETDFDVAFMPEGGYLIEGKNSFIAFKAIKPNGLSTNISINVIDEENNIIVPEIKSNHLGMGKFFLRAQKGKNYYAECTNTQNITKRFILPTAITGYCGLQINRQQNKMYVAINKVNDRVDSPLFILAHLRGAVLYCEQVGPDFEYLIFNNSFFPSGIIQFLLINENRDILSERLVFNYNENDIAQIDFKTDKESYASKEHVLAEVTLSDITGHAIKGNFSVSITDDKDILPDSTENIVSQILLTSELKGHIENPNYYLQTEDKKVSAALDLLMLTQGWRRYDINKIIRGNFIEPEYPPESSQVISGKASAVFSSLKDGSISILAIKDELEEKKENDSTGIVKSSIVPYIIQTDQFGHFKLKDIEFPEETRFIIQANNKKNRGRWVFLDVDQEEDQYPSVQNLLPIRHLNHPGLSDEAITKANAKYIIEEGVRVINLAEVVVTAQRRTPGSSSPYYSPLSAGQVITADMIEKRNYLDMRTLLSQIPGLTFNGDQMSVRGGGPPLIILDQTPYESEFFSILDLNVADVAELFLVKEASAGIMFGPRAASGALVVNTKKGSFEIKNKKSENISDYIKPLGYQNPIEFYSPKYETDEMRNQPDLRTTIYWKPNITTSDKGEAAFSFYSADNPSTYSVVIEGVSNYGHLIHKTAKIKRE